MKESKRRICLFIYYRREKARRNLVKLENNLSAIKKMQAPNLV